MSNRRDFLKIAGLGALGLAVACEGPHVFNIKKGDGKMHLRFFPYELELRHTFTVASYSRKTTPDVQVEIEYEGFTGYGEASMPPYLGQSVESVTTFLSRVDLGQFSDPFSLEDILSYVDSLSPGDSAAKAAVDIALHDLVGKLLGAPWWKIWGYDPAKAPATTFTIGIDTPEVVREKTLETAGKFRMLKAKVGLDGDRELIEAIRSVTHVPLTVDANQGWTDRFKALDMIYWLKEHGVVMVEQPMAVERIDDLAWLTERSPLPVFADESVQRLSDVAALKGVFSGINIKLMKCTGLREAHKMITLARALGMGVMLGCMTETSCAVSAAAQLSPAVDFADLDGNLLISNDRFEGVGIKNGNLSLGEAPGIGVELLS
ncbi:MAG: dipeptide epimerase [Bacteroidales bacterium]|nr:dipeptide epimerase [Bacteroidales bacterium]